jgi:3-methylfumaryl-CoA hydratase
VIEPAGEQVVEVVVDGGHDAFVPRPRSLSSDPSIGTTAELQRVMTTSLPPDPADTQGNRMTTYPVVTHLEHCSVAIGRRIAAMLDIDPDAVRADEPLPRGWHFPMLAGETPRSLLRTDGFPGLGVGMPQLDLPRLVLSRRTVEFIGDITIGSMLRRVSRIERIIRKGTDDNPVAIVDVDHRLESAATGEALVHESQTYALLPARTTPTPVDSDATFRHASPPTAPGAQITPDDTLLFQYSALCFNSHRIHIDRNYARDVERYPDLVVNGGLTTLLATEYLRRELGVRPRRLQLRYVGPLFCDNPLTIDLDRTTSPCRLRVLDQDGAEAVVDVVEQPNRGEVRIIDE